MAHLPTTIRLDMHLMPGITDETRRFEVGRISNKNSGREGGLAPDGWRLLCFIFVGTQTGASLPTQPPYFFFV
jgi:hypothetical protein